MITAIHPITIKKIKEIINVTKIENSSKNKKIKQYNVFSNTKNNQITYLPKNFKNWPYTIQASVTLIDESIIQLNQVNKIKNPNNLCVVYCTDVQKSFLDILEYMYSNHPPQNVIEQTAIVKQGVKIGKNVYIGHNVIIEDNTVIGDNTVILANTYIDSNVIIGNKVTINPNVSIHSNVQIGDNVMINPGAAIGVQGFNFNLDNYNKYLRLISFGGIDIKQDVEIGANTTIYKSTLKQNIIEQGTKIDSNVTLSSGFYIGSNCKIGSGTSICHNVTINNNVKINKNCTIEEGIMIQNFAQISNGSVVSTNVHQNTKIKGYPAKKISDFMQDEINKNELKSIKIKLKALEIALKLVDNENKLLKLSKTSKSHSKVNESLFPEFQNMYVEGDEQIAVQNSIQKITNSQAKPNKNSEIRRVRSSTTPPSNSMTQSNQTHQKSLKDLLAKIQNTQSPNLSMPNIQRTVGISKTKK